MLHLGEQLLRILDALLARADEGQCQVGSVLVQRLIDAGIDLDNRNLTGATALMYTASSGKPGMMKLLLENGADPLVRTDDDYLAAELAATEECLQLLRHTLA